MPIFAQPRPAEYEFRRADNFGIGDIRRFITLGTPHTGTSLCMPAIAIVNAAVDPRRRLEKKKDHLKAWSSVEWRFSFHAIGLDEAGTPGPEGMALIDLAAFGIHADGDPAPDRSVALNALAPVPVPYAPIEGNAANAVFHHPVDGFTLGLFRILGTVFLRNFFPSDVQTTNSDSVVPSLSARNLNAINSDRRVDHIIHWELPGPNPRMSELFTNLLGENESLFIQP